MIGVKLDTLLIVQFNGDRVIVEPMGKDCTLVRVPHSWGAMWMAKAKEICDAVEKLRSEPKPSVPEPEYAA